jgi:hypothetical protein
MHEEDQNLYDPYEEEFYQQMEDEQDEEVYLEKFASCECCHGHVYNCNGDMCGSLGGCYCIMHEQMESQ